MEGGMVDAVRRVAAGQALYVKPTMEYVPFIYTPLWFYVAAGFAKVLGVGLFSARLVSVLASIGVMGLVAAFVRREGGGRLPALLAAGLYAGTYKLASALGDLARVDSLSVLLLVAGLHALRFGRSDRARVAAAALFALAFFTKQSLLVAFVPVAAYAVLAEPRTGLVFAAAGSAFISVGSAALNALHGGWFLYFVYWIPHRHPWVPHVWTTYWTDDLMAPLGTSMLLALYHLVLGRCERRGLYAAAFGGVLAAGWLGRLHSGGWSNVIMPAFAVLAILFGLAVAAGLEAAARRPERRARTEAFVLGLAAIQLATAAYDPLPFVPAQKDAEAWRDFLRTVGDVKGDVYLPAHGYMAELAGKQGYAHEMAVQDVVGVGGGRPGADLRDEIKRALAERRFAAVIVDTDFFKKEIEETYRRKSAATPSKDGLWPETGWRVRPRDLYVPK
jgi:4-amino-4-deoxy-L-arabinose transferase-like glycosyltransferase